MTKRDVILKGRLDNMEPLQEQSSSAVFDRLTCRKCSEVLFLGDFYSTVRCS